MRQQTNFSVFNNDTYFLARTPTCKKIVPPFFQMWGTTKFANHVLPPPTFKTMAPPRRSVVIIQLSSIIISKAAIFLDVIVCVDN